MEKIGGPPPFELTADTTAFEQALSKAKAACDGFKPITLKLNPLLYQGPTPPWLDGNDHKGDLIIPDEPFVTEHLKQ